MNVFISYSRADKAVVYSAVEALDKAGFSILIDRSLDHGEEWRRQIEGLIKEADATLWFVTESSIGSEFCLWELSLVTSHCKKVIPVVLEPVDLSRLPEPLGRRHLLPDEGTFRLDRDLDVLVAALRKDVAWLQQATLYGRLAERWIEAGAREDLLLKRRAVDEADMWLARRPSDTPRPGADVIDFLATSRRQRTRWRQRLVASALIALVAVVSTAWFVTLIRASERLAVTRAEGELMQRRQADSFRAGISLAAAGPETDIAALIAEGLAAMPRPHLTDPWPVAPDLVAALIENGSRTQLLPLPEGRHAAEPTALSLSPDEEWLASAAADGSLVLQPTAGGAPLHLDFGEVVLDLLFAETSDALAVSDAGGGVTVLRLDGTRIFSETPHDAPVPRLVPAGEGRFASLGVDGLAVVHDFATGAALRLPHGLPEGAIDGNGEDRQEDDGGEAVRRGYRMIDSDGSARSIFALPWRSTEFDHVGLGVTDLIRIPGEEGFLTVGEDGRAVAWSADGAMVETLIVDDGPIFAAHHQPDIGLLYFATEELAQVWSVEDRRKVGDFATPDGSAFPIVSMEPMENPFIVMALVQPAFDAGRHVLFDLRNGQMATALPFWGGQHNAGVPAPHALVTLEAFGSFPETQDLGRVTRPNHRIVQGTFGADPRTLYGHVAPVTHLAVGRRGRVFASADRAGSVQLRTFEPELYRPFEIPADASELAAVSWVELSPDGELAVARSSSGRTRMFEIDRGSVGGGVQIDPGGVAVEEIVGAPARKARLEPGDLIVRADGERMAFVDDFIELVRSSADRTISLEVERGGETLTLAVRPRRPNGTDDAMIGARLRNAEHVVAGAFAGPGRFIAGTSRGRVGIVDHRGPQTAFERVIHVGKAPVDLVRISPSEDRAAVLFEDGQLAVLDLVSSAPPVLIHLGDGPVPADVRFVPGSDRLLASVPAQERLVLFSRSGEEIAGIAAPPADAIGQTRPEVAVTPEGRHAVVAQAEPIGDGDDRGLLVWRLPREDDASGDVAADVYRIPVPDTLLYGLRNITPFPDGRLVAAATSNERIVIVDIIERRVVNTINAYERPVDTLRVSVSGDRVVQLSQDLVRVFDAESGNILYESWDAQAATPPRDVTDVNRSTGVAMSPESGILVTSAYNRVIVHSLPATTDHLIAALCARIPEESARADLDGLDAPEDTALASCIDRSSSVSISRPS